jgi:beta-lactamase superfamily II metal-dependent hydrolase
LKIPVNKDFKHGLITVEAAKQVIKLGPLEFRIAGPSKANLKALQDEWLEWLDKAEEKLSSDPAAAAMADKSIPNLSSIVVLAKCDGKTLLLTGDARGDHILSGLKGTGLAKGGKLHVDVLKVQHHGSDRNATRRFFDAVTAETYVISANGKYGNPDLDTLTWIVESAHDQQRQIRLVLTNETDSTKELQKRFKPSSFNYTVATLDSSRHSLEVTLSS